MTVSFEGFDWDAGNVQKCQKHGVEIEIIEALFRSSALLVQPDESNSGAEVRFRGIGRTESGRGIFVVFTLRAGGRRLIRPISARYMHKKEIATFEKENP